MIRFFLNKIGNKLNSDGGFVKAVSILISGTAFAQLLSVIFLPIITRLYTPEDFSVFAVYVSLISILNVICCLRFEIAIPIPKDNNEAISLVLLAIFSNVVFSSIIFVFLFFFSNDIIRFFNKDEFFEYLWLVPVGVFLSGIYTIFQYWSTRQKQYSLIAKANIFQSIAGISVQIISGIFSYGVIGLILGQIVKSSAGTANLFRFFIKDCFNKLKQESVKNLYAVFKKNIQYPKYSIWDALANTAGIHIPILIISSLTSSSNVGYLMLAMQLLAVPITFIGRAVSQVYLAEAPNKVESGEISQFTIDVVNKLFLVGVNLLVIIGIFSPIVVKYIFGKEWGGMGETISWMIPWFIFQLVSSPISMIMYIMDKQKQLLLLTIFGFFLKIIAVYIQYVVNPKYIIETFAISSALFYLICFCLFIYVAKVSLKNLMLSLRFNILISTLLIVFASSFFGFIKFV